MHSNNVFQYSKIQTRKWNAKKSIKTVKNWNPALFGIRNPLYWNPESSTQNPESIAWNPESKEVLDSLTWGDTLRFSWGDKKALAIIQDLLNKRWMTLDLLSILQEAQRTLPINTNFISKNEFYRDNFQFHRYTFHIYENLSCLPRLCKDEQKSEASDL